MSSPVHPLIKKRKEANRGKTKIVVGPVVIAKVGDMEEKTRKRRSRRTRKEVVGYVQDVVGKKKILIQFEDGKRKDMGTCSLTLISTEEEVGKGGEDSILNLPKNVKVNCWLLMDILLFKKVAYMKRVYICLYFIVYVYGGGDGGYAGRTVEER